MKRRDFVTYSVGALAAGSAGCTGMRQFVVPSSPQVTAGEMEEFLLAQDAVMSRIGSGQGAGTPLEDLTGGKPLSPTDRRLQRNMMGSLLLVGNLRDLPVAGQVHPGVQERLRHAAPMMDSTLKSVVEGMKSMTPTARADLQSALRSDPTLGTRILKAIDLQTGAAGAPSRRRTELLELGDHVVGRMTQSPDLFLDEYVEKYEKLASRKGSAVEMERAMAARLGKTAFQARVREAEAAAREWRNVGVRDVPIGYVLDGAGAMAGAPQVAEGRDLMGMGRLTLGIGAAVTAGGWLLIAIGGESALAWVGVVGGITVGPATMLAGLIIMLIAAAR